MSKKKEISRQTYLFEVIHYDDGTSTLNRNNKGFSVLELMGIDSLVQSDMHHIFKENVKVKEVMRHSADSPLIHKPRSRKDS